MYKRRKFIFLVGLVLLLAFAFQGCNSSTSGNVENSQDASTEGVNGTEGVIGTEGVNGTEGAAGTEGGTMDGGSEDGTTDGGSDGGTADGGSSDGIGNGNSVFDELPGTGVVMPSEAPKIGTIRITTSSWIGDNYVDAVISVDGIEGISEQIQQMSTRIKLRGNTSKLLAKKSYNLKFDDKMDLFGLDSGKKWCLLATAAEKTMIRTPLAFLFADAIGIEYTSQFYMTELWLNGVYKGVYVLIEPVQEGKNRIDIDLDKGDFLIECNKIREEAGVSYIRTNKGIRFEINEPEEPTAEQKAEYLAWLNEAEAAIVSLDHTQYEKYIDIESFVNYYIFEELTKNVDYGRFSTRYYRQDGKLHAGPPWDMDLTMGNVSALYMEDVYYLYNNTHGYGTKSKDSTDGAWVQTQNWYKWLYQDEYFMNLVSQRWAEILPIVMNLVEENELGISRIDYLVNGYSDAIQRNYLAKAEGGAGWPFYKKTLGLEHDILYPTYTESVEYLRSWLYKRITWIDINLNPKRERN